jgi:hypothetical protein
VAALLLQVLVMATAIVGVTDLLLLLFLSLLLLLLLLVDSFR